MRGQVSSKNSVCMPGGGHGGDTDKEQSHGERAATLPACHPPKYSEAVAQARLRRRGCHRKDPDRDDSREVTCSANGTHTTRIACNTTWYHTLRDGACSTHRTHNQSTCQQCCRTAKAVCPLNSRSPQFSSLPYMAPKRPITAAHLRHEEPTHKVSGSTHAERHSKAPSGLEASKAAPRTTQQGSTENHNAQEQGTHSAPYPTGFRVYTFRQWSAGPGSMVRPRVQHRRR